MGCKRIHNLAPLNELFTTEVKFKWTDNEQNYFMAIKKIVGKNVIT